MGAHTKSEGKASINLIFSQRDGLIAQGIVNGKLNHSDIVVYEDGGVYKIYLVTGSWSQANLQLTTNGSSTLNTNPTKDTTVAGTLKYSARNDAQFVLNYAGNVGVGTISPATRFHVVGNENDGSTATLEIQSGTQTMLMDGNEIDGMESLYLNRNSNKNVIIAQGGGRVGIGTGNPSAKLDVEGNIDLSGNQLLNVKGLRSDTDYVSFTKMATSSAEGIRVGEIGVDSSYNNANTKLSSLGANSLWVKGNAGVGGNVGIGTTDTSKGRLVVTGGNLAVGISRLSEWPAGWDHDGIHTWDLYSEATIATGRNGNTNAWIRHDGTAHFASVDCNGLTESNLLTAEEKRISRIDRFEVGDVLCWSPENEQLEVCTTSGNRLVMAVADPNGKPIVMGAEPVKVLGPVKAGDILISSDVPGYAMVNNEPKPGTVIAQALEDFDGEAGVIKAMIRKW